MTNLLQNNKEIQMDASGKLIVEAESKGEFKLKAEEAEK